MTDVISEVVLGSFWLMLPGLRPTARPKCFAQVFIGNEARVQSFKPLIDFLAFLVQKL